MRKFATKFISRQNSVNQYFVFCLAYFVFCLAYLVFWLAYLVFVWCTWCLVYVVFCLAYIIYFWGTWCIFWRNWCLWHWDVVFLTFLNWDGASNIFITKNVQIYVFIPWINFPKSSSYRVLCGKRYASLQKVHHPRLWELWQLSGVIRRPITIFSSQSCSHFSFQSANLCMSFAVPSFGVNVRPNLPPEKMWIFKKAL